MDTPTVTVGAVTAAKNASYLLGFFCSLAYLNLSPESVGILASLLMVDYVTGTLRAGFVDGWATVKSSVAIRGAISKFLIILIPFVVALAGKGVGIEMAAVAQSSITIFILATTYSILGNIHSMGTGKPKSEFDAIAYMMNQLKDVLKKVVHDDPK